MSRGTRPRQLPLAGIGTTSEPEMPQRNRPNVSAVGTPAPILPFTEAEMDDLADVVALAIDEAVEALMTGLRQQGKRLALETYQALMEVLLPRAVGWELSWFDDPEFRDEWQW
jgi:hypothetical protein